MSKGVVLKEPYSGDDEEAIIDRLTQEEARMADAQLLKVTNMINHGVRVVADNVLVVVDRSIEGRRQRSGGCWR